MRHKRACCDSQYFQMRQCWLTASYRIGGVLPTDQYGVANLI